MKQMKRSPNLWKQTNLLFDSAKIYATSYVWWKFVAIIEGKVIFNDYRYSVTTSKHQCKVRSLMTQLGIKIDITMPVPKGLQCYSSLSEAILAAEEHLCDVISESELKREERNLKAKHRRNAKKLTDYLENSVCFRDYEIKQAKQFGSVNLIAVHQIVEPKSMEHDVQNALRSFHRDGFGKVVFYV
jgi:hypothetical protein